MGSRSSANFPSHAWAQRADVSFPEKTMQQAFIAIKWPGPKNQRWQRMCMTCAQIPAEVARVTQEAVAAAESSAPPQPLPPQSLPPQPPPP